MSKLFQNRPFNIGFLFGLVLLALINYFSYLNLDSPKTSHSLHSFGFPFAVYEYGGFITIEQILWFGLIADILIAIIFSFAIGLIFKFVWERFTTKRLK